MLTSIIALLIATIFCASFGMFAFRMITLITPNNQQHEDIEPTFILWIGLILICWLLMILSLWINIGITAFIILGCISIVILVWQHDFFLQRIKGFYWYISNNVILSIVLIVFLLFIIAKSTNPVFNYDSGLYHIQNIKWIERFPVVPGLGNLHGRFAFNSNWFLLSAFFGFNFLFGQTLYILNIFIVCLSAIFFTGKIKLESAKQRNSNILSLLFFLYTIFFLYRYVNSPITDLPAALLLWISLILFLEKQEAKTLAVWDMHSWIILVIALFSFTIKISTVPMLLIPLFLMINSIKKNRSIIWKIILTGCVFLLPWFIRNIIISGTIIYPIEFLNIPWLDWTIPKAYVKDMAQIIHAWAMLPRTNKDIVLSMTFFEWFMPWLKARTTLELLFLCTSVFGILSFLFLDLKNLFPAKNGSKNKATFFLFLDIYFFLFLVYWFITAPDPRFGNGIIIAAFLTVILRIFKKLFLLKNITKSIVFLALLMICGFAGKLAIHPSLRENLIFPPAAPIAELEQVQINPDLSVFQPITNDQCWDAPLPCSKSIYTGLSLRGEDLSSGFKILLGK